MECVDLVVPVRGGGILVLVNVVSSELVEQPRVDVEVEREQPEPVLGEGDIDATKRAPDGPSCFGSVDGREVGASAPLSLPLLTTMRWRGTPASARRSNETPLSLVYAEGDGRVSALAVGRRPFVHGFVIRHGYGYGAGLTGQLANCHLSRSIAPRSRSGSL